MTHKLIVLLFDPFLEQALPLLARDPFAKNAGSNCRFIDSLGYVFVQAKTIAGANNSRPASGQMLLQMVSREDAVAIREKKVGRGAGSNAVVPAKRYAKP